MIEALPERFPFVYLRVLGQRHFEQYEAEAAMEIKPSLDRWQYRLSATGRGRNVAGLVLEVGDGLPVLELLDASGTPVGLILGHPIDLESKLCLVERWQAPESVKDPDLFAETVLGRLAGRFLMILDAPRARRIYLDCAAQIPCVFDAETGMVGSTAHALFDDATYEDRFDDALHTALQVGVVGWFPGGLTAHKGLERLLPNHFLDLESWHVHRHWAPVACDLSADEAVSDLIATVRAQTTALRGAGRSIAQALTGGRETRMLLAISEPDHKDKLFVTISGSGQFSSDGVLAAQIAKGLELRHQLLPRQKASSEARAVYLRRSGHAVADANSWFFPSVAAIADSHVFIGGSGGETGRGFFWNAGDTADTPLDGALLAGRFGMPAEPRLIARLEAWLQGLPPELPTTTILDLAYLEQRVGPWGGAQFCADPTLLRFAPLLSRRGVVAMMSIPEEWKRTEGLSTAVIGATWPEVDRFRYNSIGPIRDVWGKILWVLRDPGLILRKLRRLR